MFGSIKTDKNSTENKIFVLKNNLRSEIENIQKLEFYSKENIEKGIATKEYLEDVEKYINSSKEKISALKEELKNLGVKSYEDKTFFMNHETFTVNL